MYGGGRGEFEHGDGFDRIESHFKDFMASHGSKPHHDDEYYNECPPPTQIAMIMHLNMFVCVRVCMQLANAYHDACTCIH